MKPFVAIVLGLLILPLLFDVALPGEKKKKKKAKPERHQILEVEFDSFDTERATLTYTFEGKQHTTPPGCWPSAFIEELVPLNELPPKTELFVYSSVSRAKTLDQIDVLFSAEHLRANTTCGTATGTPPGGENSEKRWYQGTTGGNKREPKLAGHPMQIDASRAVVRVKSFSDEQFRQLKKGTKLRLFQVETFQVEEEEEEEEEIPTAGGEDKDKKRKSEQEPKAKEPQSVWMSQCAIIVEPKLPETEAALIRQFEQSLYVDRKFPKH